MGYLVAVDYTVRKTMDETKTGRKNKLGSPELYLPGFRGPKRGCFPGGC